MRAAPVGREAFAFAILAGAHAIGRGVLTGLATHFVGFASLSAAPAIAIVTGVVALLATLLLPREVVDPHV
jgi:hypothetical protein